MIACRPFAAGDRFAVSHLDASYVVTAVWDVRSTESGFGLTRRLLPEPRVRRHVVDAGEIESARHAVVAEREGTLVGVGALELHEWNRRAVLSHLYVDRSARGMGVGRMLLEELVSYATAVGARCVWAETQNLNDGAIAFYRRCGFEHCGLDTTLYDPTQLPDDVALFFARRLLPTPMRPAPAEADRAPL